MQSAWWLFVLVGLGGYLLGSISFAVLVARSRGVNILREGSGNPGATNVKRVLGAKWGNLVFVLDFLKGLTGAGLPVWLGLGSTVEETAWLGVIGMLATVVGHCFSVFLSFKGGKGVASSIGGLAGLMPWVVLVTLPVWGIVFFWSRMVSLASLVFVIFLPLVVWWFEEPMPYLVLSILILVLIVVRHRSNIGRILQGEENRFDKRR